MIPQPFIQELLNRVDIIDVVGKYVPLRKAGANHVACCPFHSEKSPSFTVSQQKQFYHCFGCGAHGSAIGFLMEYSGMNYVEAIRELAGNLGMTVPDEASPGVAPPRKDLGECLKVAAKFYHDCLKKSPDAIAYLKKRGLSGEIAARFGIGYSPGQWRNLEQVFPAYDHPDLVEVGLVIAGEGKRYDRFRERIMFPILNERGVIIGFGGRVLEQGEPKYLNSPETPLFEKGRELYGLFQARRAISDAGMVVVVEGYMDVVALAQSGVGYAVATLGTATTAMHVQKLFRASDRIVFSFDGDNAGRKAAWRALENALPLLADEKQISFLFLPQGEDPDSFVRKNGREVFENMLASAQPLSAFLLHELSSRSDMASEEGRARFMHDARPYVQKISAPMLSLMLRKRIASLSGVELGELDSLYGIKPAAGKIAPSPKRVGRKSQSLIRQLIGLLMQNPRFAALAEGDEIDEDFDSGASAIERRETAAFFALLEFLQGAPGANVAAIVEQFRGGDEERLFDEIRAGTLGDGAWSEEELEREFVDAWKKLRLLAVNEKISRMHDKAGVDQWSIEDKRDYRILLEKQAVLQKSETGPENRV